MNIDIKTPYVKPFSIILKYIKNDGIKAVIFSLVDQKCILYKYQYVFIPIYIQLSAYKK